MKRITLVLINIFLIASSYTEEIDIIEWKKTMYLEIAKASKTSTGMSVQCRGIHGTKSLPLKKEHKDQIAGILEHIAYKTPIVNENIEYKARYYLSLEISSDTEGNNVSLSINELGEIWEYSPCDILPKDKARFKKILTPYINQLLRELGYKKEPWDEFWEGVRNRIDEIIDPSEAVLMPPSL